MACGTISACTAGSRPLRPGETWRVRVDAPVRSSGRSVVWPDEAERVPSRVEVHPEGVRPRTGHHGADRQDGRLAHVEVVDLYVEVALLRDVLPGPLRRAVVPHPLEREDRPQVGEREGNLRPVST